MSQYQVVLVTCPDIKVAEPLAQGLIEKNLAACVNILPGVQSVYRWQGAIEKSHEVLLLIKTTQDRWNELSSFIEKQHPYDIPEIISLPIEQGLESYLKWMDRK